MPSKSLVKFKKTIQRCKNLVACYKLLNEQHKADTTITPPAPTDIVRGAVVLAVASLDAYVTDVFAEKLVPYLKKYTPDQSLIELLCSSGLDTKEALKLIKMERPYRRVRTLIQNKYQTYTTQKCEVIDNLFANYRLGNITSNAAKKSGKPSVKASVTKLVKRRHEIVHAGDYNSHHRLVIICDEQITKRINDVDKLVFHMDQIICNRIS